MLEIDVYKTIEKDGTVVYRSYETEGSIKEDAEDNKEFLDFVNTVKGT